jgi:hypothetical protein
MRRPSRLMTTTAVLSVTALALGACLPRVHGATADDELRLTMVAPVDPAAPDSPTPAAPAAAFAGLADRARQATEAAGRAGADVTAAVLDRATGTLVTNGIDRPLAIASVVKLFIADDLLLQVARGETEFSPADRQALDVMLRSSEDSAAETFWNRSGGSAIVDRVAARYGLTATTAPGDGRWFNTMSTARDLVRYYDELLAGTGGLPAEQASVILANLAAATPTAPDGMVPGGVYPQRFGIPEGLPGEPVAVKQGWMCCIGADWMHLSTGVIGVDRRFVMAIGALQATDAATARQTLTTAVRTMFPAGRL